MPIMLQKQPKKPLGIYIHVPFCRSKCQYCDFYSLGGSRDRGLMEGYLEAVCKHIAEALALAPDYEVDTIYFGGGTPTFFGAEGLSSILYAIRRKIDVSSNAEITFEANPDSVTDQMLRRLKAEGFNRVSLGVQTDNDELLKKLGRPHNYAQAVSAVRAIRKAGFKNLSLDLMYGLPGQSLSDWKRTLQHVLELEPDHMSCYGLKVEEGTPLWEIRNYSNLPSDDQQADMYLAGVEILEQAGYRQYEISNFARRGCRSRHNLKYWTGGEYLGFGPSASSDFGGKRFTIAPNLPGYIKGIQKGGSVLSECQDMPMKERAGEYVMLRLRTTQGINGEEYEKKYLLPFAPLEAILETCLQRGLARCREGEWSLTPKGFLVSNSIISDLLIAQENSTPLARRH